MTKPDPLRRNKPKALEIVPELLSAWPEPSEDWPEDIQDRWRRFGTTELASVFDWDTDGEILVHLFDFYAERLVLRRVVAETPMVQGSTGQMVANPMYRRLAEVETKIVQLGDRLGRNPKARIGLGIAIADAHKSLEQLNAQFRAEEE